MKKLLQQPLNCKNWIIHYKNSLNKTLQYLIKQINNICFSSVLAFNKPFCVILAESFPLNVFCM